MIGEVIGFNGQLKFDSTKPDGTMRKLMDVGLLATLGWQAHTKLREGLGVAYQDFLKSMVAKQH